MCDLVSLESRRAEERQNKLSQALEAKRRLVTSLELQLETANLQVQLAQAEQDLAKANQDLERSQESKFSFKKARDKCFHARGHAQSLEKERAKALTAPFAVINPLPKDESFAFAAAFFLKIPVSLLDYAKSVYTAQSLLSPIDKKGACSSTTWTSHFNSYGGTFTAPTQDVVNFYPVGLQVPFHFGPGNVTQISSASELMWYPDYPSAIHYPSNPFSVSDLKIHALFRQPFAQKFAHLQWMNDYPLGVGSMDSNARHNVVFGKQNLKPIGFSKEGFLSLGNLRAFGRTQFRHIITLIKEQSVPFGHTIVKTLLFQAVHQVGEISSDSIFKWRAGLHEEGEMDALVEAMDEMVSCLEHSPRDHASFLSLASTALYFGQWSDSMHAVGRRFFDIAYAWAQDVKSRCDMCPITSPSYGELRGKLCLMTGYALFCISRLTWTETDLESYVSLLFQFYSGLGYANGVAPDLQTQIHEIKSICCIETSRRLNDVQRLLGKDSSSLTSAVKQLLGQSPDGLNWTATFSKSQPTSCFFSKDTSDLYFVDVLSGRLLRNGVSPGRLPWSILQSEIYQSTFGTIDFEVSFGSDGCHCSVTPMSGFFYKFHGSEFVFGSPPRVRIWEIGEQTLELIQVNDQLWKSDLSPRFKKLHSLWYHLESRTVLVRPKAFDDRRVILIASEGSEGRIHSVPRHNQSLPVKRLIENMPDYDWFLEPSTGLVSCISKFCPKTMLEALYCASAKMVLIRLPKFSLSFKRLDDGSFESEDFRGYRLASFQQLDYLPHFSQYLMLEPIDCRDATLAPKKLLVAQGNVTILPRIQESVSIALPNCDDGVSVHVYSYELHPRLELWEANSIASRLHLANIFTASNSFFPDRGLKMSGSQAAIELLRQCYINRPLSSEEAHHLDAVFTIGGPEIKIICHRLHVANSRLGFLYSKNIFSSLDSTSQRLRDSETHYRKVSADQTPRNEFRQGLNEEEWALPKFSPALFDRDFKLKLDLSPCLERKFCHHIEQSISALLGKLRPIHTDQDLPLGLATEGLLDHDISRDLLQSWKHFSISSIAELSDCTRISHLFSYYRDLVKQKREEAESWIHRSLSDCALRHSSAFRLLHTVDRVPSTTLTDIIRGSFDEKSLSSLNPYLSIEDSNALKDTILFYMELCVLEDKLVRLCWLGGDPLNTTKVINELSSIRVWDINKHPRWLAFEVENRLQIRQEQYKIAKHLVSYPGSICQLNMGLGKTRVILPMIVLEVLHQAHIANKLPRIHILRPLLAEFLDYIQLCLGAGLMRVRILYQPFHRDVNLTVPQVRAMWQEIDRALHSGGVQVVSVEDRMSLSLKFVELATSSSDISKNIAKELKQLLDKSDKVCVNVFDESDATLSHKLQLIYAVGNPRPLEHAVLRAEMSQAVLRVLNRPTPAIEEILNSDAFVICGKSKNLGSFQPMVF